VEIVANKATKAPFDPKLGIGGHVARFAQEHGLIVRAMGDSIGFSPPLIITSTELDDLVTRFGKALDDTVGFVTDRGLAAVA
jgi:4-aminobutyrate---pyruvate transaminase